MIQFLERRFGIGHAGFINVVARITQAVCAFTGIILVGIFLTPVEQGFYFTFLGLAGFQAFFEMSVGLVIINTASHFWAELILDKNGWIVGDQHRLADLRSLSRFVVLWYGMGGCIFMVTVGIGGAIFLGLEERTQIQWGGPWLFVVVATGFNLMFMGLVAVLEGCNQVIRIYTVRGFQAVLGLSVIAALAIPGYGLWAAGATALSLFLGNAYLVFVYRRFFISVWRTTLPSDLGWSKDILPLHWRLGTLAMIGYFAVHAIAPIIFRFHGPVLAGQIGLTMQLYLGIQKVANAIYNAKVPSLGGLVAQRRFGQLDHLAWRAGRTTIGLAALGGMVGFVLVILLRGNGFELGQRFLPDGSLALLLAAVVPTTALQCIFAYLLAYRQDAFFVYSLVTGLLLACSNFLLGWRYGAVGIASGYLLIYLFFTLPWATFTLRRCRKVWQADASP